MMQITRAEIIAVTLLIHREISLLTVPPASLNFAIRLSICSEELTITSAGSEAGVAATVDCLTDITTINHR